MWIRGYWGELDAPMVLAFLVCEKLGIRSTIKFLVDTGSSKTIILDKDAERLNLDFSGLGKVGKKSVGVGGIVDTYFIPGIKLLFLADRGIHTETIDRVFAIKHEFEDKKTAEKMKKIPSLLGRDILDKYTLVISKKKKLVLITDKETGLD